MTREEARAAAAFILFDGPEDRGDEVPCWYIGYCDDSGDWMYTIAEPDDYDEGWEWAQEIGKREGLAVEREAMRA